MKKIIWKITKVFLQFMLIIFLIVFLARINYLPVLVPETWKEWIIDTTDRWFEKQGLGNFSEFAQNFLSLKFLDKTATESEVFVLNQQKNFNNLLTEINEYLNKVTGSFEVLLSLSNNDNDFNVVRAKYYLKSLLNTTSDFNAFHVYDITKKKFILNVEHEKFKADSQAYEQIAQKIDYNKLAKISKPVVFNINGHLAIAYAFKGDTLEEKGIFFATLSYDYFKRSVSVLKNREFFNFVVINNKLVYLSKHQKFKKNYDKIKSYAVSGNYDDYFTGKKSIMPGTGYRISVKSFKLINPLFPNKIININIGLTYPKNIVIAIFLNVLLLALIAFGIFVIYRMYFHMKKAYQQYRRLKEAPFLLLDDNLTKMSKVFDKMVGSTKRIKSNVEKQRDIADRLMIVAPPKAIGYEEKKQEEKKETYGFVTEEEPGDSAEKKS